MDKGKRKRAQIFGFKSIAGGKDARRSIEQFLEKRNQDPSEYLKKAVRGADRWVYEDKEQGVELEILHDHGDGLEEPIPTVYLGINLFEVPMKNFTDVLAVALQIADGLVQTKVSIVGHYFILSACLPADDVSIEQLDYLYKSMLFQRDWFCDTLFKEMGWKEGVE